MKSETEMEYRPRITVPRWLQAALVAVWVWVVLMAGSLLLAGCTANIRMTDIELQSGGDMMVDASGATNTTDTGQLATADLKTLVDAAKTAISSKTAGVIDRIKAAISGADDEETAAPAAVSPAGKVEEVE